jgi:hypothetical protein
VVLGGGGCILALAYAQEAVTSCWTIDGVLPRHTNVALELRTAGFAQAKYPTRAMHLPVCFNFASQNGPDPADNSAADIETILTGTVAPPTGAGHVQLKSIVPYISKVAVSA